MVDTAVLSAFAIFGGSALGGALSLASSWPSQHFQVRADRTARRTAALETLYGEFIDEASKGLRRRTDQQRRGDIEACRSLRQGQQDAFCVFT